MTIHRDGPDENTMPLDLRCEGCGAALNAPDKVFEVRHHAFVPNADYLLTDLHCLSCGTTTDVAAWVIDKQTVMKKMETSAIPGEATPGGGSLLDRYVGTIEQYRQQWEGFYALDEEDWPEIDFSALDPDLSGEGAVFMPARVLAAARGLRKAAAAHPNERPAGALRITWFNCILSLDETPSAQHPYALHLSVHHTLTPGEFSKLEQHFLLSLFFIPGEVPFVRMEPGQTKPVTHFYLGAESPELNEC